MCKAIVEILSTTIEPDGVAVESTLEVVVITLSADGTVRSDVSEC